MRHIASPTSPRLGALVAPASAGLERWFAQHGTPPLLDLARSGAPALTVGDLVRSASPDALAELLDLRLDYGDGTGSVMLPVALRVVVTRCW